MAAPLGARWGVRVDPRAEDRDLDERVRLLEDREPLADRARDVRGEADVRDAMPGRLPGRSP